MQPRGICKAATPHNIAMNTISYHGGLANDDHAIDTRVGKRNCKRNIVWVNPSFSESVKNNIGKEFLKLVGKRLPTHRHQQKVWNRNTLKVSYSCMPIIATIISSQNQNLLSSKQEPKTTIPCCNCRNSANCPLNGECRGKADTYKASITSRRVARNSQWGAVWGVWGQSPQPPETRGTGGGAPSARKFCIFLQK